MKHSWPTTMAGPLLAVPHIVQSRAPPSASEVPALLLDRGGVRIRPERRFPNGQAQKFTRMAAESASGR